MFLLTLTIDEFMQLDARDHQVVIALFDAEIQRLSALDQGARPGHAENPDALASLRSVRKVHQGRLAELQAPAAVATETLTALAA